MAINTLKVSSPNTSIKIHQLDCQSGLKVSPNYMMLSARKKKDTSTYLTLGTKINSKCVNDLNI